MFSNLTARLSLFHQVQVWSSVDVQQPRASQKQTTTDAEVERGEVYRNKTNGGKE